MILDKAKLTSSGRPVLLTGEIEKALLDKVDLEFDGSGGVTGQISDRYKDGYAILTTHRVLWIDGQPTGAGHKSCTLPLSSLHACRKESKLSGFKYKTRLELLARQTSKGTPAAEGQSHALLRPVYLRCYLSPDVFLQALEDQLRLKPWRASLSSTSPSPSPQTQGAALHLPHPSSHSTNHQPTHQWPSITAQPAANLAMQSDAPQYNRQDLQQLLDMGFPRNRSIRALMSTHNAGVQAAMDWILAFGDQPGVDDPIDDVKPSALAPGPAPGPSPPPSSIPYHAPSNQSLYPSSSHATTPHAHAGYGGYHSSTAGTEFAPNPLHSGLAGHPYEGPHVPPPPTQSSLTPWASGAVIPPPPPQQQVQTRMMTNPMWDMQHAHQPPPPSPSLSYSYGYPQQLAPNTSYQHQPTQPAYADGGLVAHNPIQHARPNPPPPRPVVRNVGVAGILHREEQKLAGTSRSMQQAFSDLKALMAMAGEMVKLAEKFRGVMGKVSGDEGDLVDVETQLQLSNMGIMSPVTKETAGSRYHTELSKQLADFLEQPLAKAHGMLTLPDVYCLFNRARGTELVSPDDLLTAIQQFEKLGLPMRLRKFPSGVVVVQSAAHSDEEVCSRLADLVAGPGCGKSISASEVAAAMDIPLHIAQEHLLTAEGKGVLCRDDAPAGVRFFRNFFMEVSVS